VSLYSIYFTLHLILLDVILLRFSALCVCVYIIALSVLIAEDFLFLLILLWAIRAILYLCFNSYTLVTLYNLYYYSTGPVGQSALHELWVFIIIIYLFYVLHYLLGQKGRRHFIIILLSCQKGHILFFIFVQP